MATFVHRRRDDMTISFTGTYIRPGRDTTIEIVEVITTGGVIQESIKAIVFLAPGDSIRESVGA